MRQRRAVAALAVVLVVASGCERASGPEPPVLPDAMSALGDSITAASVPAFDKLSPWNPALSWATGGEAVGGHFARLVRLHPPLEGRASNHAVPGARISSAPAQAEKAVADGADYVTFLFGANDVCTLTPVDRFEADLRRALGVLARALPESEVFVVSIPDLARVRELYADDQRVRTIWDRTRICPPVLDSDATDEELAASLARWEDFNRLLAEVCEEHANCRHDRGAVAARTFGREEVSPVDGFHPSVEGQRRLAEVTWEAWLGRS
ncbi:MAG: SGNH/GDSL hydrolase family protein [Nitriliruptorales bacterium]